jgi:hypothetical protein
LVAHADDPVVAPILQRVTERRVAFLTEAYAELGLPAARARPQAVVAYSAYVGWMQLRRATPSVLPEVVDDPDALAHLVDNLTGPTG